jgi:hypothetical protein
MKSMNRILLIAVVILSTLTRSSAQSFMNEWIDHNKTYYKFRVGATGMYRITQAQLTTMGIAGADAASFQLWRNGQEVPIFTSAQSGPLPAGGFIEFWGEMNDGVWEKRMYLRPEHQINERISLLTDSSTYFLTINTSSSNKRLQPLANDLSTSLTPESFFMHKLRVNYRNAYNLGFGAVVGDVVYSSSYDEGEGYASAQIAPSAPLVANNSSLFVASGGPAASLIYSAGGRSLNIRTIRVSLNGTVLGERQMNYFNAFVDNTSYTSIPVSLLSSNNANLEFRNTSSISTDRMVVGMYELTYPRQFNFGGQTSFEFTLPASAAGNNLVITNFNNAGVAPVLYDLTNGLRITADISVAGQVRVVLPPSATERRLVLAGTQSSQVRSVTGGFQSRSFINYLITATQSNFIIISNPLLYADESGANYVDQYRIYRSSIAGGGYNAKVYDIEQLIDQFGWGIKNNPMSIRNFLRFARQNFAQKPEYCFLIGKGVQPQNYKANEIRPVSERMNLIPTFGLPSSDMTLAADEGSVVPRTPIGRLNAVYPLEVKIYLDKVIQYEQSQKGHSCVIEDETWKKNMMHIGGANDFLGEQIMYYLNQYKQVVEDTLFGGNVTTLQKSSLASVQTLAGDKVTSLFNNGFSLMTYFGHSSANTLEFNLDNPNNYPATGKFPIFMVNGCNAGNLFLFDTMRLNGSLTLSEKYLLSAPGKGSIAFIASTHLGIVNYLHLYTEEFYNQFTNDAYGRSVGTILSNIVDTLIRRYGINDFFVRMHVEQITLHGDPALKFFSKEKPDYAIEPQYVKVAPEFISIAENEFKMNVKLFNLGKITSDSVMLEIKRQLPNGTVEMIFNEKIRNIRSSDSLEIGWPINPLTDKGANKLIVTIDPENEHEELCETNNTVTKEFFIFEDEIRPTYPYNYSIINKQNITFFASTANPLGTIRKYYIEVDTTTKFNSPLLKRDSVSSVGGSIAFKPAGLSFTNDYVYYWRVGIRPEGTNDVAWNNSSFVYRSDLENGYNQSNYYQFTNNTYQDIFLDSVKRDLEFKDVIRKLKIKTGLFPYFSAGSNDVYLDLQQVDLWRCGFNVFSIYVFEPKTLKSWLNRAEGSGGRFGSLNPMCLGYERKFFEYSMNDRNARNRARLFLENVVPDGSIILIVNQGTGEGGGFASPNGAFIQQWMSDTTAFGSGNSIYHTFIKNGLTEIDKFTKNLPFAFVYEKGNPDFVRQFIGEKENDFIDVVVDVPAKLYEGTIETPWLGPAKSWKNFQWDGFFPGGKATGDSAVFHLWGRSTTGAENLLAVVTNAKDTSISYIDAAQYPYLKMKLVSADPIQLTPFQLQYWRLTGNHIPEGAIAPNLKFAFKDTLDLGEPLTFSIAFQNVSEASFDSLKLKLILTDRNNVPTEIALPKKKPLVAGDTLVITHTIDTKNLPGLNALYLMVNPDEDQPEQFLFNNFVFKNFFVKPDLFNPWLDVTFDGVHILNRDIVSSKPHILVKLKDENRFLALNDTAGMKVKIRFPDRTIKEYVLGTDSARFTPANLGTGENTATIDLYPFFREDGEYELFVSATDRSGNKAGDLDYKVAFQVINKPMISNLLNYPNPFTTSTAFVFTLTGSEVPQNMRIQILTITGKVVREITKNELGPIRIGRNITEFKWDGTDQYGNKLANGIYLYRVLTNLNGSSLEKYQDGNGGNTDKYFNKGYGKMYLMR